MKPSETLFVGASELAGLMRTTDWSEISVGVPEHWPEGVRAIVRMMLTSRYAMWMGWGPDLTFFYNDAYARMTLGSKHPRALGKPASQVWSEIWSEIGPRIAHVLATGEATWDDALLLFLERSGFPEETYHTFSYSPVHQDDGRIAGIFCVVTEETERVIGERRLTLLRVLGSQLASGQTIDDVWSALDRSLGTETRDLPFALTYLFNTDEEIATLVVRSNVRADDPIALETIAVDDTRWPLRSMSRESAPAFAIVDLPETVIWPRGPWQTAPTRAVVVPLTPPGQARPAGVFIAGLNPHRPIDSAFESFITLFVGQIAASLANAQAYLNERLRAEALAKIDRAKTTFFSNVSHELRTPLTLIVGPVADALESEEGALKGEALALVARNAQRLRKLVNTLLDFSRLESGRVEASYEPMDLGLYTADLASGFRSVIESAGVRFVVDSAPTPEPTYIDRNMWEKIVLNLISNAFKYTFEGEIGISVECVGDRTFVRVRDSGTGIPAEELPRIFERFHRVDGAVGRTQEGTGIGLSLVQELVKLHGGSIEVESEVGRGTTFIVAMRAGSAHLPAQQIRAPRTLASTAIDLDTFIDEVSRWTARESPDDGTGDRVPPEPAAPTTPDRFGSAARILLVDDNPDMRGYLTTLLGRYWLVQQATDGDEALRLAREQAPDLIITDVMMPRLDGFGLVRELRAGEATRSIPIMMLSARAGDESRLQGIHAGADDYLMKPFTARELLARVEGQLLRARIRGLEERSSRRISSVFAQAPVPIAVLRGPDHVFEMANDALVTLVRRPVLGRRVVEAFPEILEQGMIDLLDQVYTTRVPYVGRQVPVTLNRGADGAPETVSLDIACQPLVGETGAIEGIAAVVHEVTELVNARQAADLANRTKDEFLAMLGHELRNPLAPILTALQLLRLRGVEGGERERTIIERQVRHLVGLVDDLLDISRITRGKVRLNPESIELNEIVAKAIELASPLLEQHQHRFEADVPRIGLAVMADSARLAQVVSNLLTNAAKYTPPGGRISVTAWAEREEVVLRVSDTGMGIDPDMLPRVFDLFTQDRQAIDRAQGGLGLGLAIVRSFVTLHGGTVTARSDGHGRGSEFIIRLPRIDAVKTATPALPARAPRVAAPSPGLRVLVVDDNNDAAVMLADALAAAGHTTTTAHDGPTALGAAVHFKPDVALLDIGLPVMDGFELARQFRALPELNRTRLIAITGYGQEHDRQRSASVGFDAHLVKPVDVAHLSQLVGQLTIRPDGND